MKLARILLVAGIFLISAPTALADVPGLVVSVSSPSPSLSTVTYTMTYSGVASTLTSPSATNFNPNYICLLPNIKDSSNTLLGPFVNMYLNLTSMVYGIDSYSVVCQPLTPSMSGTISYQLSGLPLGTITNGVRAYVTKSYGTFTTGGITYLMSSINDFAYQDFAAISTTVVATMPNRAPVATITSPTPNPYYVLPGAAVYFSGTGADPDTGDYIAGYEWWDGGCGTGTLIGSNLYGAVITKSNLTLGLHQTYFRVKDSHNLYSSCATTDVNVVTVIPNLAPTATITSPTPSPKVVTQGTYVWFDGTGYDPDWASYDYIATYEWRDGSCSGGTLLSSNWYSWVYISTLNIGLHTIYFRVKDSHGLWSTNCPSVQVQVNAPVCSNGAVNYSTCNQCATGYFYSSSPPPTACAACNNGGCTGAGGSAGNPVGSLVCNNGATNAPYCSSCPVGKEFVLGMCTLIAVGPICNNNNVCDAGETLLNCYNDCKIKIKYQQF